jgi:hypothetical protein
VNIRCRSYTIAAGVLVDGDPDGILFQQGTLLGGHVLYIEDGTLHYTYNWLGESMQRIAGPAHVSPGRHIFTAEFSAEGRADDDPSTVGTLTLYVDETRIADGPIKTQPGKFGLGSGLCVGRGTSPSPDPRRPAPGVFTGGQLEAVVVDVSGDTFIDHELEVRSWLARD